MHRIWDFCRTEMLKGICYGYYRGLTEIVNKDKRKASRCVIIGLLFCGLLLRKSIRN